MSKLRSVTSRICRELSDAGYPAYVSGKLGDTALIEVENSSVDIAVYRNQKGDFELKLGHADKFEKIHRSDLVKAIDRIQKPSR